MLVTQPPPQAFRSLDIKIPKIEAWVVDSIRHQAALSPQKTLTGYMTELLRQHAAQRRERLLGQLDAHWNSIKGAPSGTAARLLRSQRDEEGEA